MKTTFVAGLLVGVGTVGSLAGAANGQIAWVARSYNMNMSWSGGDPMGSFTSGSASGASEVGGTNTNWNDGGVGPFAGNPSTFFGDGIYQSPQGGEVSGGWNNYYTRNPAGPMGGATPFPGMQYSTTSTSTRSFSVSGSGEYVFSIVDTADFYRNTFSEALVPYSQLALQGPGTYSAGVFTPGIGAINLDLLTSTTTLLSPGTYRVVMAFGGTFEASASFNRANEAAWGVYPIPTPGCTGVLMLAGAFATRRRR